MPTGARAARQVSHELSVPAVTAMLLSAVAFATAACAGLALADALTPRARACLQALAALAALGTTVMARSPPRHPAHPATPAARLPSQSACPAAAPGGEPVRRVQGGAGLVHCDVRKCCGCLPLLDRLRMERLMRRLAFAGLETGFEEQGSKRAPSDSLARRLASAGLKDGL
jgi:hypothetical protein